MATRPSDRLLVDLERYPVLVPGRAATGPWSRTAGRQLGRTGAAEIPGFISPTGVPARCADAESLADGPTASGGQGTAYLEFPDFSLPPEHPRLHFADYAVGAVAYDITPHASPLRLLYEWDPLKDLIADVLDRGPIYRYARPLRRAQPGRHGRG